MSYTLFPDEVLMVAKHPKMTVVLRRALSALIDAIDKDGQEFPDAHARVAIAFQLSDEQADALQELYDDGVQP